MAQSPNIASAHGPEALRLEAVDSIDRFAEVAESWDALWARARERCPLMRHAVIAAWHAAFGGAARPHILLVWQGGLLVGAAPLAWTTERLLRRRVRMLGSMHDPWLERSSLLLARPDPGIVRLMLRHAMNASGRPDVLAIGPLDPGSQVAHLVRAVAQEARWPFGEEAHLRSLEQQLPADWETLLSTLSPSFRATVRRKLRHAAATPGISARVLHDADCLEAIIRISPCTWQADAGSAITSRPEVLAFYDALIRDAARDGRLRCGVLYRDEEPIAFDLNVVDRTTLYSLKLGYRKEEADLSAGVVLRAHLLREVLAPGAPPLHAYDLMGTDEPYKREWTSDLRTYVRLEVFASRPSARLLHALLFRLRPLVRRRAPGLLRRLRALRRAHV